MAYTSSVSSGVTISGQTVTSGGSQIIWGGSAYKSKLYGFQALQPHAGATSTIVYKGGSQYVGTGAISNITVLSAGAHQGLDGSIHPDSSNSSKYVSTYAKASNTTICSGASQTLHTITSAYNTIISSGGLQEVHRGGIATKTTILSGGSQVVAGGTYGASIGLAGIAKDTTISKGGTQVIGSACIASNTTVLAGGTLIVQSGGKVVSLDAKSGSTVSFNDTSFVIRQNMNLVGNVVIKGKIDVSDKKLSVSGIGNSVGSIISDSSTKSTFDLKSVKSKPASTQVLSLTNKSALKGTVTISMNSLQQWGEYKFAKNVTLANGSKITLKIGSKSASVSYYAANKNVKYYKAYGTNYAVHGGNSGYVTVSAKNAGGNTYNHVSKKTTKSSDGFYHYNASTGSDVVYAAGNTKFNDKIYLKDGRDVVVYDKTKWGKDNIQKTNGTCTVLFKDLSSKNVTQKLSGSKMVITKNSDKNQSVTIEGWSKDTHKIVFGSSMTAFDKYLKAASPTAAVTKNAYNEAFKKAGLSG